MAIATTPEPPYYVAVITVERGESDDGYAEMADAMHQLAKTQPGFLGMEWVYKHVDAREEGWTKVVLHPGQAA